MYAGSINKTICIDFLVGVREVFLSRSYQFSVAP
jgi:hypothetical protein